MITKRSEHGLGHLKAPADAFEDELWEWIINTDVGRDWPEPKWFDQPALGRTTINTPHDLQLLREINRGMPYSQQIRPGGFLTLAHAHPIEPPGLLIAPYSETTAQAMNRKDWIHRGTGNAGLRVRTDRFEYVIEGSFVVLDYRHYAVQYMSHREWKGQACRNEGRQFVRQRSILVRQTSRIGKELGVIDVHAPVDDPKVGPFALELRVCGSCGKELVGRRSRWCSETCRAKYGRRNRSK